MSSFKNNSLFSFHGLGLFFCATLSLSACVNNPVIYLDQNEDRIDFEAVVASFPEYRGASLPYSITPLTQANYAKEKERLQKIKQAAPKPVAVPNSPYLVGINDVLSIIVWEHPELSIPASNESGDANGSLVSTDGSIFYPYVGNVIVAGLTLDQIRTELTRLLSITIEKPQLDVRVAQYRSRKVFVVGEVNKPGLQPITDEPLTVIDAIDQAEGFTESANLSRANLTRNNVAYTLDLNDLFLRGQRRENLRLLDGDILTIPDIADSKFYVLGQVENPVQMEMTAKTLVLNDAIKNAGGVKPPIDSPIRNPNQYFVIRNTESGPMVFHLDGAAGDALILLNGFEILPNDIIYVIRDKPSNWNLNYQKIVQYADGLNQ